MTPGARVAAAIEILDQVTDGMAAEQVLTRWARGHRFAGSKDRAAIRDHVFDVLRCWRSAAHLGGAQTGRGLMIGMLRQQGVDPETLFTGEGHAPPVLLEHEKAAPDADMARAIKLNLPDWLIREFDTSLGDDAEKTALALQGRAPVTMRVNTAKTTSSEALLMLDQSGVTVVENPLGPTALTVLDGSRRVRSAPAYQEGFVELQDASSQAVVDALPRAARVLDYCAGGGGKALALAARDETCVFAHDIDPARMSDLPSRAARAGAQITQIATQQIATEAPFDLVLVDAPCSGSGSWRRAPEAKWRLTPERLKELTAIQDDILDTTAPMIGVGGTLAYATCSVLHVENEARVQAFLDRHPGWTCIFQKTFAVSADGDGFFTAHLTHVV